MKKQVILSLYPSLQRFFRNVLSLTCVSFDLENHLSLSLQCIEQGFSHIHVLLKMQYLIQVSLNLSFLTKWRLKKNSELHAALDSVEVSDSRTEGLVDSQLFHWVSLWLEASCIISLSVGLLICKMQFIHIHVAHNDAIRLNWCLQSSSWSLWERCYRNSKL